MKKKIIYFINIILVFSIIFQPLFIKAESTPNKGDLRCPVESNSDNCLEIKDANGKKHLVPFVKQLVPFVDLKTKTIVINDIEGLIE